MKSSTSLLLCSLLLCGSFLPSALRAEAPATPSIEERLNKLETELAAVRQENATLRSQLGTVAARVDAAPAPAAPVDKWPKLSFQVLGSFDYHMSSAKDEKSQLELGDVDLVVNGRLNEHASALADFVVASDQGGFGFEVERLIASYKFNDAFNLDVGRFHTAIGWYNNFYHNGTYFQTTQDRPEPFIFEDNGGILPVHSIGFSLNGAIPSGSANLSYSFEVANGRNFSQGSVESLAVEDDNNYKSVNLQVRAKPDRWDNWQFGAGIYHDTLTPEVTPGAFLRVDQLIFSTYAVYKSSDIEWFTEFFAIGDKPSDDHRYWTEAGYTQVSKKFGQFRPYARLQWRDASIGDPVLGLMGQNESVWGPQLGVRFDFTSMMAVKFEIERSLYKNAGHVDEFFTQLTFRI